MIQFANGNARLIGRHYLVLSTRRGNECIEWMILMHPHLMMLMLNALRPEEYRLHPREGSLW